MDSCYCDWPNEALCAVHRACVGKSERIQAQVDESKVRGFLIALEKV
jgi:hypothetical protein